MRQEIQAIVLAAGPGSRLTTVGVKSKCLLPVGNFPIIYYSLKLLQDSGFDEVTVLVNQNDERELNKFNELYGITIKLDLVVVNTSNDPGTADTFRSIESKIKKNVDEVLIMSSDLISDVSLLPLINFHCSGGAALTLLVADQRPDLARAPAPGPKSKMNLGSNDIFCIDEVSKRLMFAVAGGDYDDRVAIPRRAVESSSGAGIEVVANLVDAHVYIMNRAVVDYIVAKESPCARMGSLKAEIVPHLILQQFALQKGEEVATEKANMRQFLEQRGCMGRFGHLISSYNASCIPSRFSFDSSLDATLCLAYSHPGLCLRVNTIGALWHANVKFNEIRDRLGLKTENCESEEVNSRAQICPSSLIGTGSAIAEKTNIRASVVGRHCRVAPCVRVANSVLFDYVHVSQGCVIENSLICVNIERRCVIKNCIVSDGSVILENQTYENELLEKGLCQDYSY